METMDICDNEGMDVDTEACVEFEDYLSSLLIEECASTPVRRQRLYKPLDKEARDRRNARRRKPFNPIPRVLKSDIRRSLPSMMVNVLNSFDSEFALGFLNKFCRADCSMIDLSTQMDETNSFSMLAVLKGTQPILQYFMWYCDCSPDSLIQVHSSQLRTRQFSSTIISSISIQGTYFSCPQGDTLDYYMTTLLGAGNKIVHGESGLEAIGPQANELNEVIRRRSQEENFWNKQVVLMRHPKPMLCKAFLILNLDSDGRIVSMDLVDSVQRPEDYYLPLARGR